jgi:hypothetical protein
MSDDVRRAIDILADVLGTDEEYRQPSALVAFAEVAAAHIRDLRAELAAERQRG